MDSKDRSLQPSTSGIDAFPSEEEPRQSLRQEEPHESPEPVKTAIREQVPRPGLGRDELPRHSFGREELPHENPEPEDLPHREELPRPTRSREAPPRHSLGREEPLQSLDHEELPHRSFDQWDDSLPARPLPPPRAETSSEAPKLLAAAFLVVAVVLGGYLVFRNREATTPATAPVAAAPSPKPEDVASPLGADVPAIDLPPLDESDQVVRGLVKELSANPSVTAWLATDNLIRRFTVVVTNISAGEMATGRVPTLKPRGGFLVEERGEDLFISPRSYARYLPLTTAVSSINPEDAARLYTMLKPRIEDAYRELGQPNTTFDQTLQRAIVTLIKTPIPEGPVPVEVRGGVTYRFADPALERLTPSQKLLIRFGPENQRAVQTSLRNIALALGIPADKLP